MSKFTITSSKSAEDSTKKSFQVFSDGKPVGPAHSTQESANAYKRKLELEAEDELGLK